jgi:hypothetical protein
MWTTSLKAFFDHIRKKWAITAERQMNRFLGISYTWDREKGSCKASAAAYIARVAKRFGLEDTRTHATPMEAGFEISESDFVGKPTEEMMTLYRSLIGSIGYAVINKRSVNHRCVVVAQILKKKREWRRNMRRAPLARALSFCFLSISFFLEI